MIHLSPQAAQKILSIKAQENLESSYLRFAVETGCCGNYNYTVGFSSQKNPDDLEFESEGLKILVDPQSHIYLDGCSVAFQEQEGEQGGFHIQNPNAPASAGCPCEEPAGGCCQA